MVIPEGRRRGVFWRGRDRLGLTTAQRVPAELTARTGGTLSTGAAARIRRRTSCRRDAGACRLAEPSGGLLTEQICTVPSRQWLKALVPKDA
jgi:hypothetical protein